VNDSYKWSKGSDWVPPKPSTRTWWYSDLKTRNVLCKPFTKKNVLSILIDIVWMCGRHQASRQELEWSMHLCALGHLSYPANGLYKLTNPDALIWLQEQCCFPTYWLIRIYHTPDAPTCNLYRDRSCCACALSIMYNLVALAAWRREWLTDELCRRSLCRIPSQFCAEKRHRRPPPVQCNAREHRCAILLLFAEKRG